MNKFEKLIDLIVNEDSEQAKKLFHSIVVEHSRKIYEGLMEDEISNDKTDDLVDDLNDVDADEEGLDESASLSLSESEAKQLLDWMDGTINETDASDLLQRVAEHFDVEVGALKPVLEAQSDEILDIAYGEEGEEGGLDDDGMEMDLDDEVEFGADDDMDASVEGEADIEDRVIDLEDAIDELQAEFDQLISAEESEGHDELDMGDDMDADGDMGDMGDDDEFSMDSDEDDMDESMVREYVEKVSTPGNSEEGATNRKSIVAKKNDMGGTTANIAKGSADEKGGSAPTPANVKGAGSFENDPKAKAGKTFKAAPKAQTKEPAGTDKKSLVK